MKNTFYLFFVLILSASLSAQETVNSNWNCGESYIDSRDGREYTTTLIGEQCWFTECLKYKTDNGYTEEQNWYINNDIGIHWVYGVDSLSIDSRPTHSSVPSPSKSEKAPI